MVNLSFFSIAVASALASLICVLICVATVVMLWVRLTRSEEKARQKQQYLEQQIGIATSGAIGMGHRIVALERKLQSLQDRQDNITGTDTFAYSQALQMFEQGADVATVASNCGFSSSEAELMALVQKQAKNSSPRPSGQNQAGPRQTTSRRKAAVSQHE
jgi:uncharacterized membrane protein YcjF (UPF0283 family)